MGENTEPGRDPGATEEEAMTTETTEAAPPPAAADPEEAAAPAAETPAEPAKPPVEKAPPMLTLGGALRLARKLGMPEQEGERFATLFTKHAERAKDRQEPPPPFGAPLTVETPEEAEERRRAAAEARRARRSRHAEVLRQRIPQRFQRRRFQWQGNPAHAEAKRWTEAVRSQDAGNLFIHGVDVGVGKSHALWDLALRLSDEGLWVVGWSMPDLNRAMRPNEDPEALQDAMDCDVLFVDEIGAEKRSDWTQEQFYSIVNSRWGNLRPMAATSNLDPDGVNDCYGTAVADRFFDGAVVIEMAGMSRRGAS